MSVAIQRGKQLLHAVTRHQIVVQVLAQKIAPRKINNYSANQHSKGQYTTIGLRVQYYVSCVSQHTTIHV